MPSDTRGRSGHADTHAHAPPAPTKHPWWSLFLKALRVARRDCGSTMAAGRPPTPLFGTPQARADVCARQALGVSIFTRFSAAVHVHHAPQFWDVRPATAEAALALLSIATNTLSWRLTDAVAFGLLHVAFALRVVEWPSDCYDGDEEFACLPLGLAEQRLARIISSELRSERFADTPVAPAPTLTSKMPSEPLQPHNKQKLQLTNSITWMRLPPPMPCRILAEQPTRSRHRVCLRCRCHVAACGPSPLCPDCFRSSAELLARITAACGRDVRQWKLLEATSESAPDGSRFDFLNEFGRHALTADDPAWSERDYVRHLGAHASGRASPHANPRAGPLEPSLLGPHLGTVLGGEHYVLRSVVGSGTEAVRSFWDLAEAFAPTPPPADGSLISAGAQILMLRGAYVGGSGPQQAVSGLPFVRDRAMASTAARRLDEFVVDAPYRQLNVAGAIATFRPLWNAASSTTERARLLQETLDEEEQRCLTQLDERLTSVRERGSSVAGVLVEFVRAYDGYALTPAYVHALERWAHSRRLLLFDDSVLLGLRCGAPFASALYGISCHWVAIGKLFGFSGVVQNSRADHHGGYDADVAFLNGYITCNISPLEVLRCRVNLAAIAKRKLWRNAAYVGPRLCAQILAQGLDCWGVGLAIWFDHENGGVQNATTLYNRLLPPLTLTPAAAAEVVVRCGLFSHLPSLLNSALGRTRAREPPRWDDPLAVIQWHAESIAKGEQEAGGPREPGAGNPIAVTRRRVAWGAPRKA